MMRIVYLTPGAAGMICGSCFHDNTLAGALRTAGHDILLTPLYTPLKVDEADESLPRVFYGGINVFLQQKLSLFRHTPWLLDSLFDQPALLRLATSGGSSVDAGQLGDITLSMLQGESGNQRKELAKLLRWLRDEVQPEVVHLSNLMLLGMAREIRKELRVPLICTLSGEDIFLDKLVAPFHRAVHDELRVRANDVDAFVAMNQYYAGAVQSMLGIPTEKIHIIEHGLNLEGYSAKASRAPNAPLRVGYLARVCPEKGIHLLIDACGRLQRDGFSPPFELHVAGYLGAGDRPFWQEQLASVAMWPEPKRFRYHGEVSRAEKIAFLQSLDLLCVPTVYRESKGISLLEGMASSVPILVPNHGVFPELVADTGGGKLFPAGSIEGLTAGIRGMLGNLEETAKLGVSGRSAVIDRYQAGKMAERTVALYQKLLGKPD
jgi:glycosyltransferase involved in cell wall biosynthesis